MEILKLFDALPVEHPPSLTAIQKGCEDKFGCQLDISVVHHSRAQQTTGLVILATVAMSRQPSEEMLPRHLK